MLKARHAAERLQGAWHGGLSSIDQLRGRMQDCLAEFAVSRDEAEVPYRCFDSKHCMRMLRVVWQHCRPGSKVTAW